MNEYEKLLARARSQVPEDAFKKSGERFKVPKVQLIVQGNRSIWQNFQEIISILNRPGKEVLKFVAGQLATAGIFEGSAAIFNGKFSAEVVDEVLSRYIDSYVICPVCTRPDTTIVKEGNAYYLHCSACGARTSIRPV
ncbi:MAG TPA: translation initiation factor IF-2 subunit beta [Candidatus Thorarchaeota archaeon]|nr:MAG: translation initiation factor IF-2 subunit beta [Candidatus Thorarchaeota archaeon]RLI62552.1 MAG: translation initiation factor IF-2 subunit beta [Candidatus Thorarchaeota archaeon]HDD67416.1 translation initiation factor IF-2 subunit beta [Candidatus Thorarchaeota archaeon]